LSPDDFLETRGLILGSSLIGLGFVILPGFWLSKGSIAHLNWGAIALYPGGIFRACLGGPLGEEPGWRGFALPKLQAAYGPMVASMILGLLWSAWHLPLFLVPGWTSSSLLVFVVLLTAVGFILNFAFNISGGSVIVAMFLHAMFNASSEVLGKLVRGGEIRKTLPAEVVLAISFGIIACLLAALTRARLMEQIVRPVAD
jgi:membrane protease YdiL (CAAX protease family)